MITIYTGIRQHYMIWGIIWILAVLTLFSFSGSEPVLHVMGLTTINATMLFISRMLYWLALALLALYCSRIEKQPLLLWKNEPYSYVTYLVMLFALLSILLSGALILVKLLSFTGLSKTSEKMHEVTTIMKQHSLLLVFTCVTAGVTEELIFRGYMQPRLEILFKSPVLAVYISALFFGLLHYRWGTIYNMLIPFYIGLIFAYYYFKYRNIKLLILFHFLWDLSSLLLSTRLSK
jgi:membrane protease YdiL (CAAX protease family)